MGGQFWQKNNPARRESRFSGSEQVKNITSCIVGALHPAAEESPFVVSFVSFSPALALRLSLAHLRGQLQ